MTCKGILFEENKKGYKTHKKISHGKKNQVSWVSDGFVTWKPRAFASL